MTIEVVLVILLALALLVYCVLAEQPIWLALLVSGGIGVLVLRGSDIAFSTLGSVPFSATAAYSLVIIPMFILMGVVASKAGIAEDVYAVAQRLSRRLPGGLGIATILACGGFAAVTGSSVATVATVGRIAIGEMTKHGYRKNAAAALVAAGGTLGVLIPPSVILVVYAALTGESIGRLLLAGIVPGVVTMFFYSLATSALYRRGFFQERATTSASEAPRPQRSEVGGTGAAVSAGTVGTVERAASGVVTKRNVIGIGYVAVLVGIVVGGLYTGLFTATESGAIAAAVAFAMLAVRHRRNLAMMRTGVVESLRETASLTSMIFALLVGGGVFAFFLVSSGLPNRLARNIVSAGMPPLLVVVVVLVLMVILGFFLDSLSILVLTIPITYPVISEMGVDGIWFAILVVKAIEIGMITPPVGLNVYVVSGSVPGIKPEGVFKAVLPFGAMEVVTMAVLIAVPGLVTWLPDIAFG